jgi:hypothetical protein
MIEQRPGSGALEGPCRVEVQNVRRDRNLARVRVLGSLVALVAVPWVLGRFGSPLLAVLGLFAAVVAYFWSATSLAGTDRGPGERRPAGHGIEEIMRIVEDATAPLEQRVAAALAARPNGGEAVQKRIRVAAEACVEPRLRVALEKASAGELEDEELEEIGRSEARTTAG